MRYFDLSHLLKKLLAHQLCVVVALISYSALQHDLDLLYDWTIRWQLKFNILKCKHIHLGPMHHFGPYYLNGTVIDSSDF